MHSECVNTMVPVEMFDVLNAVDLAEKGAWPDNRGTLFNTQSFTEAVRLVWMFSAPYKAKYRVF